MWSRCSLRNVAPAIPSRNSLDSDDTVWHLGLHQIVCGNPDILGGTPVFSGTRVPVRILIEYLEAGDRLDDFLDSFPTVSREQAIEVLETAKTALIGKADEAVA